MIPNHLREASLQDSLLQFRRIGKIPFLRLLPGPQAPAAVLHDVGVKNVRAQIIGVIRLQKGLKTGRVLRVLHQHPAGQKHTHALPSDIAAANFPVSDPDHVLQCKIIHTEVVNPRVFPHKKLQKQALFLLPQLFASAAGVRAALYDLLPIIPLCLPVHQIGEKLRRLRGGRDGDSLLFF